MFRASTAVLHSHCLICVCGVRVNCARGSQCLTTWLKHLNVKGNMQAAGSLRDKCLHGYKAACNIDMMKPCWQNDTLFPSYDFFFRFGP